MCTYVRNAITLGQGENVISMLIADMLVCCYMKLYFDYIFMRCGVVTTDKHLYLYVLSFCQVNIIHSLENSLEKKEGHIDADKMAVLNGWRRVGCRTREALRRSSLFELIDGYEVYAWLF